MNGIFGKMYGYLATNFVGRDTEIQLVLTSLIAKSHTIFFGPPGTAKSAIISTTCKMLKAFYFSYLLQKFSKYEEVFGSLNIKELRESGKQQYMTTGKLPEAKVAFLDETFRGNSAILNSLLQIMNEREFYNGETLVKVPLHSLFGASNLMPEDSSLDALFDRFLFRHWIDNIKPEYWEQLLASYWKSHTNLQKFPTFDFSKVEAYSDRIWNVDISTVTKNLLIVVKEMVDQKIEVSDRQKGRCLLAIAASTLFDDRTVAEPKDLLILRYVIPQKKEEVKIVEDAILTHIGIDQKVYHELKSFLFQIKVIADDILKEKDTSEIVRKTAMLIPIKDRIVQAQSYEDPEIKKVVEEELGLMDLINNRIQDKISI